MSSDKLRLMLINTNEVNAEGCKWMIMNAEYCLFNTDEWSLMNAV